MGEEKNTEDEWNPRQPHKTPEMGWMDGQMETTKLLLRKSNWYLRVKLLGRERYSTGMNRRVREDAGGRSPFLSREISTRRVEAKAAYER